MADLDYKNASQPVQIVGGDSTGVEQAPVQSTISGGLHVNLRDAAGNEEGTSTNPINVVHPAFVSLVNSTSVSLGANATFTGTSEDVTGYAAIGVQVFANQASASLGFMAQHSVDGINWDDIDRFNVPASTAGNGKFFSFPIQCRFFRVVYTNGPVAQTTFRLQTIYHRISQRPSSHRIDDLLDTENDAELSKAIITGKRVDGQFDTVKQSNNNELRVADILDAGGLQGAINVGTTAVAARVGGANLANRKVLTVTNLGNSTIYWGYTNAVTVASGTPLVKAQQAFFTVGANTTIFLISAGATNDVRITEGA